MKKLLFPLMFFIFSTGFSQEAEKTVTIPDPLVFETSHQGTFHGKSISYKAISGETFLKNNEGEPVAALWSTSYIKSEPDSRNRPVTFIFNGGPGSASVWLHMGVFGPKIVKVDSDAKTDDGAAPFDLVNNELALLDITDLVFIDPVGTGFSKVIGKRKGGGFLGVDRRCQINCTVYAVVDHQI